MVPIPVATSAGLYPYEGRFWSVPKNYVLPKTMLLKQAWFCWINGVPENRMSGENGAVLLCPIKPFRFVDPKSLPSKLCDKFRNDFLPFMKLMCSAPDLNLPSTTDEKSTIEFINSSFDKAIAYARTQCEYLFLTAKWKKYSVSYCSKKIGYTAMMKFGTDSDKLRATANKGVRNRSRRR